MTATSEAGGDDGQLRPAPRVGPVAGALDAAAGAAQPGDGGDDAEPEHRQRQDARGGVVEDGVRPDADADQADEHQGAGRTTLGGRGVAGAAVAAGVHAGREREGALEGVLEHRHQQPAQPADPAGLPRPQRLRGAHPAHAVGELRQHADRDHQRGPDLVERRRHRAQQPLGVGQRVGGADADHDRGEPEPVVQREEQRLRVERPEQGDPGDPVGQRDRRQVEQHPAAEVAAEDEPERHPDHHDHDAEPHVEPERLAPRLLRAPQRDDQRGDPDQHQQDQRVGGQRRGDRQPDRPQPPGHRVQVAGPAHGGRVPPPAYDGDGAARGEEARPRRPGRPRSAGRRRPGRPASDAAAGAASAALAGRRPSGERLDRSAAAEADSLGWSASRADCRRSTALGVATRADGRRRGSTRLDGEACRRLRRRVAGTPGVGLVDGLVVGLFVGFVVGLVARRARRRRRRGVGRRAHARGGPRRAAVPRERDVPALGDRQRARPAGGVGPRAGLAVGPAQAPVGVGRRGVDARVVAGSPSTRQTKPGWRCT